MSSTNANGPLIKTTYVLDVLNIALSGWLIKLMLNSPGWFGTSDPHMHIGITMNLVGLIPSATLLLSVLSFALNIRGSYGLSFPLAFWSLVASCGCVVVEGLYYL